MSSLIYSKGVVAPPTPSPSSYAYVYKYTTYSNKLANYQIICHTMFPVHYPTRDLLRKLSLLKQGVNNLHYHINDLNAEKIPSQQ